jgi:hypothetical protein
MEYKMLSNAHKIEIIDQKIFNYEQLIFHIDMLLAEHESTGLLDEESINSSNAQVVMYIDQISALNQLKQDIQNDL